MNESFEKLMLPHYNSILAGALKLCRNMCAAEDLAQDTFMRAFNKFDLYDPERSSPITWLANIMHHRFFELKRHRTSSENVEEQHLNDVAAERIESRYDTMEELIEMIDSETVINAIKMEVGDGRDGLIVEWLLEGRSMAEICQDLKINRTRIYGIRSRIADSIRPLVNKMLKVDA